VRLTSTAVLFVAAWALAAGGASLLAYALLCRVPAGASWSPFVLPLAVGALQSMFGLTRNPLVFGAFTVAGVLIAEVVATFLGMLLAFLLPEGLLLVVVGAVCGVIVGSSQWIALSLFGHARPPRLAWLGVSAFGGALIARPVFALFAGCLDVQWWYVVLAVGYGIATGPLLADWSSE
jgi:hypothetical protein